MVAVAASEQEVLASLAQTEGVWIAAVNGPTATVLSGAEPAVLEAARRWAELGRKISRLGQPCVPLRADGPDAEGVPSGGGRITLRPPRIPVISTLTGKLAGRTVAAAAVLGPPGSGTRQVRRRYCRAGVVRGDRVRGGRTGRGTGQRGAPVRAAAGGGDPRGATRSSQQESSQASQQESSQASQHGSSQQGTSQPRSSQQESRSVLAAVAALHVGGVDVDWSTLFTDIGWRQGPAALLPVPAPPLLDRPASARRRSRSRRDVCRSSRLRASAAEPAGESAAPSGGVGRLAGLPEGAREQAVLDIVRTPGRRRIGHDGAGDIDPRRAFTDLGFDSTAWLNRPPGCPRGRGLPCPPR